MPVLPSPTSQVYDTATSILNEAKGRLAHAMPSLFPYSGNILGYTQANTQQMFNSAWRKFQDALCDAGSKKFYEEVLIEEIPVVSNQDPAIPNSISWFQCFDGDNYTTTPVLPSDLVTPLFISERLTGSGAPFPAWDTQPNMRFYTSGIPKNNKQPFNGCWEWRGEVIYYPGALQSVDFMIRYRKNLPDIVDVGNKRWFTEDVPMVRCQDPMAWWLVVEVATAEAANPDSPAKVLGLAQSARMEALEATKKYVNRDVMLDEYTEVTRIGYGTGSSQGSGWYGR